MNGDNHIDCVDLTFVALLSNDTAWIYAVRCLGI